MEATYTTDRSTATPLRKRGYFTQIELTHPTGSRPRWRQDGRELYYLRPDLQIVAVDVSLGAGLQTRAAHPLFRVDEAGVEPGMGKYDVAPDGRRFLVNTAVERRRADRIVVVLNWPAALNSSPVH